MNFTSILKAAFAWSSHRMKGHVAGLTFGIPSTGLWVSTRGKLMILLGPGREEQTELEGIESGPSIFSKANPDPPLHRLCRPSQLALSFSAFGPQLSFVPLVLRHSQTGSNPGSQRCLSPFSPRASSKSSSSSVSAFPFTLLCLPFFAGKNPTPRETLVRSSSFSCCISFSRMLFLMSVRDDRLCVTCILTKEVDQILQPSMSSWIC